MKTEYCSYGAYEDKRSRIMDFRPIDDIFFEVIAADREVCQEILRTILEDDELIVDEVRTQESIRNLYGRSARLDALCRLKDGTLCNIEIQRADHDNHLRRARYNASIITVRESVAGEEFQDVREVYVVYISEFDFLKGGKTIYHVDKVIRETGEVVDNGLHEIFVNTTIDDGSDIAELMSCFTKKEVKNSKFPALSRRVTELKETEGGFTAVSKIMDEYVNQCAREWIKAEHNEKIVKMIQKGYTKDSIMELGYTEEEYEEAEKSLLTIAQ
ncbi:MAG: PD-(D/E)XK nuclease family transposase [Lachnospiraceae bacterium]|nr:PD-(D/E)XK nuclease family transposase [Lachnospiraceae bacterium]